MGGDTVVGSNVVRQQWLIDRWMRCLPGMCKTSLMFFFFFWPVESVCRVVAPWGWTQATRSHASGCVQSLEMFQMMMAFVSKLNFVEGKGLAARLACCIDSVSLNNIQ